MKYKILFGIIFLIFFIVILVPHETISIPEWKVAVVDRQDNPMPNVEIRQTWSHGRDHNEETSVTNKEGIVIFPARTIRQPLLLKITKAMFEKIENLIMPHGASVGSRGSIFPASGARSNILKYPDNGELEHKLILLDYPYEKKILN